VVVVVLRRVKSSSESSLREGGKHRRSTSVRVAALQWQQVVYTSPEYALFSLLFTIY
jgi:hypothetical protein